MMKTNLNYCIVLSAEQLIYLAGSRLGYDKKTISRVLDKMNQLGIVASAQSNRTSIHTLKCISAWMLDGNRIDNPFYVRLKDRPDEREDTPVISDENKLFSPYSSFPSVSVYPQTAATEDFGGDVSANNQI